MNDSYTGSLAPSTGSFPGESPPLRRAEPELAKVERTGAAESRPWRGGGAVSRLWGSLRRVVAAGGTYPQINPGTG